ncbi:2-keto-4-pentenoate hydratase [Bdellovibrio bacteriovorus]|uniref:2-keto-4-pentenoate hydratase n=1 Tax=Bdellovibrio bacteriovorus TaxID=959 RepID=A0A150WRL9_BDEBC|nr:fumarylacetoacetate hydrolase family protein [Bdellovibrio bacteriovorus]KYG66967.1 2-keto-4-pentenoate hydratase [Bdellovibrio bacteriovorus]
MKLGSLKSPHSRDGELCVVSKDLKTAVKATQIAPNLREALEHWKDKESALQKLYTDLNAGTAKDSFLVNESEFHSAMPRTWLFADGSAFIHHIKLVRMARKAPLPETLETVPLMYQGECGQFLAPTEDIPQRDFSHGTDFEGEVGVITDFVPMGITPEEALKKIRLLVLINDVSLRGLIPEELAQGFGFFQSKPASALSPFTVTPDELGTSYQNGRINLPLTVNYNGEFFGKANAGAMHFHFGQLIAHAAKTRNLAAGSIIGSGTVSNDVQGAGSSCLAEKRMIEQIETGSIKTPFMKAGDTIEMEMLDEKGHSIFGRIFQKVKAV